MSVLNTGLAKTSASGYTIDQSLRFNDDDSAYLSWTPASAGNRRTFTFSAWIKRATIGTEQYIFDGSTGSDSFYIRFNSDNTLQIRDHAESGLYFKPNAVYRDCLAWYHFVLAVDTTQGTEANRVKFYVNGEQVTSWSASTYPSQNDDTGVNGTTEHRIGIDVSGGKFDGYMAEVHFIDGTALTPSSFGKTGDYGEWKPMKYSGSYGTNGFYLPFKQDYTVEGFSTVLYTGNGGTQYIGGTGFQPDLTWIKARNSALNHQIHNAISGTSKGLNSNNTNAEYTDTNAVTSFDSDGWSMNNNYNSHNMSGYTYVAWNWDMGGHPGGDSYGIPTTVSAVGTAQHSTAQAKIGASSILLDGNSDYISGTANFASYNILDGDFTMEGWFRFSQMSDNRGIMAIGTSNYKLGIRFAGTRLQVKGETASLSGLDAVSSGTHGMSTNEWNHIAIVRENGTTILYVNGDNKGTSSDVYDVESSDIRLGHYYESPHYMHGYIDEVRLSNKARYTSNFTPSTTAFSNDANTMFLLHSDTSNGSTTFVDSSGATPNTTGTITSQVRANTTYGQSIVSYTGDAQNNATIGHGLNSTPELVIIKPRSYADNWVVTSSHMPQHEYSYLNSTNAFGGASNNRFPGHDSDTINFGTYWNNVNNSGDNYIAYCFDSVSGYSKFGTYEGTDSTHTITLGFRPAFLMIKNADSTGHWTMWDNTRNPYDSATVGKQMLRGNTSGAEETKTDREPTFLDTGFSIGDSDGDTNQNGDTYIYMAFADNREYAYWLDQSGNNNDWTSNNLTESDISVDSPTNNFCTLNPLAGTNATHSEGNLKAVATSNNDHTFVSSMAATSGGKWYWESIAIGGDLAAVIWDADTPASAATETATTGDRVWASLYYGTDTDNKIVDSDGTTTQATSGFGDTTTDVHSFLLDLDNWTFEIRRGNVADKLKINLHSAFRPDSILVGSRIGIGNWPTNTFAYNFGQDSSFAGEKTAQGNQDSNGIGDFYYTPPSGFLALCTQNLPEPTVVPSEHFNTVLYSGTGSDQYIGGVGYQPDFTWIKQRSGTYSHILANAISGDNKFLSSNGTGAEETDSTKFQTFETDGFNVGSHNGVSQSGNSYVAWNWKANGSGSANTNGSINSTVSANTDAGFSIVGYTASTGNSTVGHGLSKAPELLIIKARETASTSWAVGSDGMTSWEYSVELDTADAEASVPSRFNSTAPTSSVFSIGTSGYTNINGEDFIAYCFHSVDDYSKVGSYVGNSSTDGAFVYTGFSPAYVMIHAITASQGWWIFDNTRDTDGNPMSKYLGAERNNSEYTADRVDFVSNGFKWRHEDHAWNHTGYTYIYLAFAETPFKYSNAK